MRARLLLAIIVVALLPGLARAQSIDVVALNTTTTDTTVTTTSETVATSSGPATVPRATVNVCVLAWAQLTTGTNTTAVTPRIRRGSGTTGTVVGDAVAITIGAAAGSNEQFQFIACEERSKVETVEYAFTLQQTGASANGSILQAGIIVIGR